MDNQAETFQSVEALLYNAYMSQCGLDSVRSFQPLSHVTNPELQEPDQDYMG
jgi:hypothetical protein